MIELTKTVNDPDGLVKKLIFEDGEGAIAEMVVYQHDDRGVVCFSVQSGCPVGCKFCGTGKRFIRNLTQGEITNQLNIGASMIEDKQKRQFMAMSMGEPMLNFQNLVDGFNYSAVGHNDHFYISTVGIRKPLVLGSLLSMGKGLKNFGLQFSLHSPYESERRKMLGNFGGLMSIEEIKHFANLWKAYTGKQVYFNYICRNVNPRQFISDLHEITKGHHLTLSVMCNTDDFSKGDPKPALDFANVLSVMYPDQDYSVFDPAGQDTIGGGCGQLLYVQEKLAKEQPQ
jgi:23S rRNA (adenine2503-C2)-methyltransferase